MTLDDVRELKSRWLTMLSQPLAVASPTSVVAAGTTIARAFRSFRERRPAAERALRAVALGVVSGRRRQVRLAIRLHRRTPDVLAVVEQLRIEARNEVDVQYIGRLTKMAKKGGSSAIRPEFYQQRRRPLRIGSSVSDISPSFLTI